MLARIIRLAIAPIALAVATTGLLASPSQAITGPNIAPDYEHTYVGLIAFYDDAGEFSHRCSGTLLSDQVFLTAGHCVTLDDAGTLATTARIWFEQDAGADYDPLTDTPATSGYPYSGGVEADTFYENNFRGLTIPETNDVGLVVLDEGALAAAYPEIDDFATLGSPGTATTLGTGPRAVVDITGYGVTRANKNHTVSYRSRLGGSTFIVNTHNSLTGSANLQLASNFGAGRVGTCFGDSGGPVLVGGTDTVIGVNSFVLNSQCAGLGFAYRVDVKEVQDWMAKVLGPLWDDVAVA